MHSFRYADGSLKCEGVDLESVAAEVGTPAYVYSAETIRNNYRRLDTALAPRVALGLAAVLAAASLGMALWVRLDGPAVGAPVYARPAVSLGAARTAPNAGS